MIDTTQYKSKLEDEKTRLEEELSTVARPNESVPGEWEAIQTDTDQEADPNDQAGLLDEYQENRALVDVLNKKIQRCYRRTFAYRGWHIRHLQHFRKGNRKRAT
jgi:hypothetical protein